ncbi:MAG: methyltransferase domain-containing protein [Actinomycetota bacterium]
MSSSTGPIHRAAADGYQANADVYRRARPAYHPELVARVVDRYTGPGAVVVDLGAGTGVFTAQLVAAGVRPTAVEPVEAMRAKLTAQLPAVTAVPGTAEAIPAEDAAVDTVVVAQAMHWFDHGPALDELARVLRPGGHLVTVWNVRDETVPWVTAYTEIVDRHAGDTPRHRTMRWRRAIDDDGRFEPVDDWSTLHPVPTDPDGVVGRALSTSFIAALSASDREAVADELRSVVAPLGDSFDYPYRAELQAWRRR